MEDREDREDKEEVSEEQESVEATEEAEARVMRGDPGGDGGGEGGGVGGAGGSVGHLSRGVDTEAAAEERPTERRGAGREPEPESRGSESSMAGLVHGCVMRRIPFLPFFFKPDSTTVHRRSLTPFTPVPLSLSMQLTIEYDGVVK